VRAKPQCSRSNSVSLRIRLASVPIIAVNEKSFAHTFTMTVP